MQCKKCKKDYEENELKNGICKECLEKCVKIPLYKKWWFWLCIVAITIIISFSTLIGIALFIVNSGISEVAIQVESIDNECTLYTSAGGNTVVVEIPNYKDETKLNKVNNIKQIIKDYSLNDNVLSNYSKFILIYKINSDNNNDSIISISTYKLPEMTEIDDESKIYYDLIESTTNSLTNNNNNSTSTSNSQSTPSSSYSSTTLESSSSLSSSSSSSSSITLGQKNALSKAKTYIQTIPFSYSGLIEQLEYEGYTKEEATYGADNVGANWNEQAAKKAKNYIDMMSFSRSGLIEQLEYEGFTKEQAEYGASAVGY